MASLDQVSSELAAALARTVPGGAAEADRGSLRLRRGTVVSHAGSAAVVTTDGLNNRTAVPWLASYSIVDGDDVWLLEQSPLLVIIGKSA